MDKKSKNTQFNNFIFHKIIRRAFKIINKLGILYNKEKKFRKIIHDEKNRDKKCKPIFIIGLPRSGTTLLYQLVLNNFHFYYLTVMTSWLSETPLVAYKLQNILFNEIENFDYKSSYGNFNFQKWFEQFIMPSEGHDFYETIFTSRNHHEYNTILPEPKKKILYNTINELEIISGLNFINKNPRNSLRLIPLSDIFPDAIFLLVERDPIFIAQSLFKARIKSMKKDGEKQPVWWGTKPSNYSNYLSLGPLEQSIYQSISIKNRLKKQISLIDNKIFRIDYKDLCENPQKVVQKLENIFFNNEIILNKKKCDPIIKFESMNRKRITDYEFKLINDIISNELR